MAQAASLFVLGQAFEPLTFYRTKLAAHKVFCDALENFDKIENPENWHNITPKNQGVAFIFRRPDRNNA
jgi:hypothetical protein